MPHWAPTRSRFDNTRKVTVLLDDAELTGDLCRRHLRISPFTGVPHELDEREVDQPEVGDRHGGGDLGRLRALSSHLRDGTDAEIVSSRQASALGHVLAFLDRGFRCGGRRPTAGLLRVRAGAGDGGAACRVTSNEPPARHAPVSPPMIHRAVACWVASETRQ